MKPTVSTETLKDNAGNSTVITRRYPITTGTGANKVDFWLMVPEGKVTGGSGSQKMV